MRVAIVDAYSTGKFLAPRFRARGVECVHVQSDTRLPGFYVDGYCSSDFIAARIHRGELTATLQWLREQGVGLVLAGCEPGVNLAEQLSVAFGTSSNGQRSPGARRDKYLMAKRLREHGLACAETHASAEVDAIVAWAARHGRWPVVVKPVDSAGTDHVYFCNDLDAVRSSATTVMASDNLMGAPNQATVVQEFLAGTEYFVNTVSRDAQHHVAEVWSYHKTHLPGRGYIYDYEEPLPWDDPRAAALRGYVLAVLDALEVRNGPAHTELILTERGPVLLESGARLAGSILPDVVSRCFGTNHVELTVEACLDADAFARRRHEPYRIAASMRYVSLIVPQDGRVRAEGLTALRALESYAGMLFSAEPGTSVARTIDSKTSPGVVYLIAECAEQLARDYERLRHIERTELFEPC